MVGARIRIRVLTITSPVQLPLSGMSTGRSALVAISRRESHCELPIVKRPEVMFLCPGVPNAMKCWISIAHLLQVFPELL